MSARSSSCSWSGSGAGGPGAVEEAGGRNPRDIIDLDKYMRGAVRPPRPHRAAPRGNELVVDAGAVERKVAKVAGAAPQSVGAAGVGGAPLTSGDAASSSSGSARPPHAKRFSHDSGLSDGSYARRKYRPHRRMTSGDVRSAASGASLRAFRAACERALRDHQAQIVRVAQLCEQLTEARLAPPAAAPVALAPRGSSPASRGSPPAPKGAPPGRSRSSTQRSSDVSSSSRSTRSRDARRNKQRTEECKTYKIIMNKLDELNKLFAARGRPPPPGGRPPVPSSGSVSVSDKVVSTEPTLLCALQTATTVPCRANLQLSPAALPRYHAAADSLVQGEVGGAGLVPSCDPTCGFDLNDPLHLYSQAKQLQALPATTQRARPPDLGAGGGVAPQVGQHARCGVCEGERQETLCALCRHYWRALTRYVVRQLVCGPESADPSSH